MGIIPTPTDFGNDCLACYSAGETPQYMKCFFAGIKRGAIWTPANLAPPNGYHDVMQSVSNPCTWNEEPPGFPDVLYTITGSNSYLRCKTTSIHRAFISNPATGCLKGFNNNLSTYAGNIFYGGWGHLVTAAQIAAIISKITPLADPDPRMEYFPISSTQAVVRYAGKKDATLISMLVDLP